MVMSDPPQSFLRFKPLLFPYNKRNISHCDIDHEDTIGIITLATHNGS